MLKIEFRAMGCQMTALLDWDTLPAARLLQQTPAWFEEWEQSLSRFRADSELNRLNASAGQPFRASPVLFAAVRLALEAAGWSEGMVVPTVLPALEKAGYDRSFELLRDANGRNAPPNQAGETLPAAWQHIELDENRQTILIPAGARLDLGGSAKGWAALQAAQRLGQAGPALVEAAGDIAISGRMADGAPWPVDVADPLDVEDCLVQLALEGGGVATSGIDRRRWRKDGQWKHHIIDPRSGEPARTDLLSVTVVAPDVCRAEAAAKTALILGSQAGLAWLEARPDLGGLLALPDGQILYSQRMFDYLWREYDR